MNFNKICREIKQVKIQGAENIAIAALKAYSLKPKRSTITLLKNLRPTEPALLNALKFAYKYNPKLAIAHFIHAKKKISKIGVKVIKNNSIIFTHCHSSTVIDILKEAKKKKNFKVVNTETRPLYQGRKTAKELAKARIPVTMITDTAAGDALTKGGEIKKVNLMLIGADAILKNGNVINKIGSNTFAELAHNHKIPVYIACNSWKFSNKKVEIEERSYKELWERLPKHVKIKNPAFEVVNEKFITSIISELGILKPERFVKEVRKVYPWIK